MSDRYLWDGSGEPDPEIQELENALAPLRHRGSPQEVLRRLRGAETPHRGAGWIAAAAAALAVVGVTASLLQHAPRPVPETSGEVFETDARSHARLDMGSIGRVEILPSTRLRVLDGGKDRYRLALDRGALRAVILAPPGDFLVETPSARAVDLGCVYTLRVDDVGAGLLTVELGWVALEHRGRESFVPAGAQCATRPREGPGLPYYLDAPDAFRTGLAELGREVRPARRRDQITALGLLARPRDAMTLWHLLTRVSSDERALVFDRLAALVPPPSGITREGVLQGDRASLDAWWNELGLGTIDFWRTWKAAWSDPR